MISVRSASRPQKTLIDGLLQFYVYDFSEMEPPDSDRFEFDENGGFGPFPDIDDYWRNEQFHPLLIREQEKPVGFALLNTHSHRGGRVERNMGEFFVARKHRRRGFAAEAVRQILSLYPGQWEIAVAEQNMAAKAFWPRAIASAPNVSRIDRLEGDGEHWRGPIWSFYAAEGE
jgi:predicted acetyltransferase